MNLQNKSKEELIRELQELQLECSSLKESYQNYDLLHQNDKVTILESEARYRNIFDNAIEGMYQTSLEGKILRVNNAFAKMMGYDSPEEVTNTVEFTGTRIWLNPKERLHFISLLEKQEMVRGYECRFKRKDGQIIWVSLNSRLVYDKNNNKLYYEGFIEDITVRRLAEESIREREAKYEELYILMRLMSDTMPDLMWAKDLDNRYIFANKAMCQKLLIATDTLEPLGKTDLFFAKRQRELHPENPDWHTFGEICANTDTIVLREMKEMQFDEYGNVKGKFLFLDVHKAPMFDTQGKLIGVVGSGRDITQQKQAENDLIKAKEKVEESEQIFKAITLQATDGIALSDLEGNYIFVNQAFCLMTGYKEEELFEKTVFDIEQISRPANNLIGTTISTQGKPIQIKLYRKDGSEYFAEIISDIIKINDTGYVLKTVREITERLLAEDKLRESEKRLRQVIDLVPHFIFAKDINGKFILVNKAIADVYGTTVQNLIGKSDTDFAVDKKEAAHFLEDDRKVIESQISKKNIEESITNSKGVKKILDTTKIPFSASGSNLPSVLGISVDITERKQVEEDLIKAKEKAEESDKLKSAFLQNISHEVRTPLNAISGFANLMSRPNQTPEKLKKFSHLISISSERLIRIITDVIEMSQIQANQIKTYLTWFDFVQFVKYLSNNFSVAAKDKNIKFDLNIHIPYNEYFIFSDKRKLSQIFSQLIDNAIKFTNEGSVEISCNLAETLHAQDLVQTLHATSPQEVLHAKLLQISIKDTGIGISDEMQKVIFEPFRQIDTGITRNYGGNGLGLSIVKAHIELLQGSISLKSELNKGTTIIVSFPLNDGNEEILQKSDTKRKYSINTILIVEDVYSNFRYLKELLSGTEMKIIHATNGKQALDLCKDNQSIDLVLMDIEMPVMDGHTATKLIKAIRPELPVIAQTAYALDSEKEKFQDAFDDYLTKPISKAELNQRLMKYMVIEN